MRNNAGASRRVDSQLDGELPTLLAGAGQGDDQRRLHSLQIIGELHLELVVVDCRGRERERERERRRGPGRPLLK